MSLRDGNKILDEAACPACGEADCYDWEDSTDNGNNVTRRWWCEDCGASYVLELVVTTRLVSCEREGA